MFFVFLAVVIYMKTREGRFCKAGRTHEEYVAYLNTNRSRFDFAKFTAIMCLIAGLIDGGIALFAIISDFNSNAALLETMTPEAKDIFLTNIFYKYLNAGFGGAADLVTFAPVMLLFDYTRTYENTTVEMAIPLGAIVVLVFIYLEAFLFGIGAAATFVKGAIAPVIEQIEPILDDPEIMKQIEDGTLDVEALLAGLMGEEGMALLEGDTSGAASSAAATTETTSSAASSTETTSSAPAPTEEASSEVELAQAA